MSLLAALVLGTLAKSASAQAASTFTAPAASPTDTSSFYVGANNGTLPNFPPVPGAAFDRFIQIWLENTDYDDAAAEPVFQSLSAQGLTLTSYYGLTHPSQPNYMAAAGGSFWGLSTDDFVSVPANVSTIVDLLEQRHISWSQYQENMPTDGFGGYNYMNPDGYTYYYRKHNPNIMFDSVTSNTARAARIRNFNDFAVDLENNCLPQWIFVTPNMKNDGHDTDVTYASQWLDWWLVPLLEHPNFNTYNTLILLTFDENKTDDINNQLYSILLGSAVPQYLRGTTDDTFYTHYSTLSTVEANWRLGSLGRGDTNKTLANVFSFVADATGYRNNQLTGKSKLPPLNISGTIPGPLNPDYWAPWAPYTEPDIWPW